MINGSGAPAGVRQSMELSAACLHRNNFFYLSPPCPCYTLRGLFISQSSHLLRHWRHIITHVLLSDAATSSPTLSRRWTFDVSCSSPICVKKNQTCERQNPNVIGDAENCWSVTLSSLWERGVDVSQTKLPVCRQRYTSAVIKQVFQTN